MSGVNTSSANAQALSLLLSQTLQSNINRTVTGLALLPVVAGTGKAAYFTAQFTGAANASAVADGARVSYSDADNETEQAGTLNWSIYSKVASVSGLAQSTAMATKVNYAARSLLGDNATLLSARIHQQVQRLNMGLGTAFFSGDETASPTQLGGIANSVKASGTYAGINPGTYTEWVSTAGSVSAAALSFDTINSQLLTPIFTACGEKPSVLVTDPTNFDRLRALYGSATVPYIREMVVPGVVNEYTGRMVPSRRIQLDAGAEAFSVQGIPVIRDKDCTAGKVYALNLQYLQLHTLSPFLDDLTDLARMKQFLSDVVGGGLVEQMGQAAFEELRALIMNPLGPLVKLNPLGRTGDSDEVQVVSYNQVMNTRRQAHGVLTVT